mgnify:CR=1 FL=1
MPFLSVDVSSTLIKCCAIEIRIHSESCQTGQHIVPKPNNVLVMYYWYVTDKIELFRFHWPSSCYKNFEIAMLFHELMH